MGCGESIVKYLLFIFNLIFALSGLVLLGLGTAGTLKVRAIVDAVFKGDTSVLPVLAIAVGSLVFFIAFFGCCGAIMESDCMLITFSVFMLLLIIVKIAGVVVMFTVKELIEGMVEILMKNDPNLSEDEANIIAKTGRFIFCGIFMGIGALELIAMVFGCCLANHVRNKMRGVGGGNVIMMH